MDILKLFRARENEKEAELQARADRIAAAFPDEPDWVREQVAAGHDVADAVKARMAALEKRLVEAEGLALSEKAKAEKAAVDLAAAKAEAEAAKAGLDEAKKRPVVLAPAPASGAAGSEEAALADFRKDEEFLTKQGFTAATYLAFRKAEAAGRVRMSASNKIVGRE